MPCILMKMLPMCSVFPIADTLEKQTDEEILQTSSGHETDCPVREKGYHIRMILILSLGDLSRDSSRFS